MFEARPGVLRKARWLSAALGLSVVAASGCAVAQASPPASTRPDSPARTIDIQAYDVAGNTKLQQLDIEKAVYPFLGPQRSLQDVEAARDALEKAYHARGFQSVVVEIPPQSGADGVVRFNVLEAPVGRMRVVGSRYFSPERIRAQASSMREGEVPNFQDAQRQIAELNRLPDERVTPVLKPGVAPGTVDVDLKVSDTLPLHASLEVNNDHPADTVPIRVMGTIRYANLWQLGHAASFTYVAAPQKRTDGEVFAASYLAPVWGTPWSVLVFGYDSNSNVSALGGTAVLGKGYAIGARGILQLPTMGGLTQSLNMGFDFKHFTQNITVGASTVSAVIDYWPATIAYSLARASDTSSTTLTLSATMGTRGFGSGVAEFQNNRAFANANFVHANLDFTQTQTVAHDVTAFVHLTGQISDQPLVANEQMAAGGAGSVRGYLQSEGIGDSGLAATVEVRGPSFATHVASFVDEWRVFGFLDAAHLVLMDPLPEQQAGFTLVSVGLGTRIKLFRHLFGDVAVGVPLKSTTNTTEGRPYAVVSVKSEF